MGIAGEGVTDADCGTQHIDCAGEFSPGTHCQLLGGAATGLPAYHACACTATSCGANTDGTTVCDANFGFCRLPQDFETPSVDGGVCAPGYEVVTFSDNSVGCVQTCSADGGLGTCSQSWTSCDTTFDLCLENTCSNFYGACPTGGNATGGTCLPVPGADGGDIGFCEVNGSSTSACDGFFGDAQSACAAGDICRSTGAMLAQDFSAGACYPACDLTQGCTDPSETCLPVFATGNAGFCVGTQGGDSFGACGSNYEVCRFGEDCSLFAPPNDAGADYFACACNPASTGPDSCASANDFPVTAGGGGNTVCDENTLRCRQPRDLEPAFDQAVSFGGICASGYVAQNFGALPNDAGTDFRCVQDCSAGQACNATWTACNTTPSSFLEYDGGNGFGCYTNFCGLLGDGGFDLNQSWTACDAGGAAGNCQPLPTTTDGGYLGLCLRTGTATHDKPCTGYLGDVSRQQNCTSSELCLPTGYLPSAVYVDGGAIPTATCQYTCNAGTSGPAHNSNCTAANCTAFTNDPASSPEQAGICL